MLAQEYLRRILKARVYDVAQETPLDYAVHLSEKLDNKVLLKREDLQPVFSFKLRGAYNRMVHLTAEEKARGVITASAGNHAQGVALAASRLKCRAVICMPITAPSVKVESMLRSCRKGAHSQSQRTARRACSASGTLFLFTPSMTLM